MMNGSTIYFRAAGGVGAAGVSLARLPGRVEQDAEPVSLRPAAQAMGITLPRLTSRFAQLAVLGAAHCLDPLAVPIDPATPLWLATGLGDIARTDALYYEVMPPRSEMASPAAFATSGNNLAAFLVAQRAGLMARNLTLSRGGVSVEQVLIQAIADLRVGSARSVLCGSVDETTTPREFFARRHPAAFKRPIGEGSAWWLLTSDPADGAGELLHVSVTTVAAGDRVSAVSHALTGVSMRSPTLHVSGEWSGNEVAGLQESLRAPHVAMNQDRFGCFPTTAGLALAQSFVAPAAGPHWHVHVGSDPPAALAVIAWKVYGTASSPAM